MKKISIALVCFFVFNIQCAKAQHEHITLVERSYSSFNQGYYTSPGSTSYNFYFKVGKNETEIKLDKNADNLKGYIKVCPDALANLNKYIKYKNVNYRSKVGLVLSGVALLPGAALLLNGLTKPNIPLAVFGGTFLVGGTFGLIFCSIRNKKSVGKAQGALYNSVSLYNQYIIDNKLSSQLEN